MVLPCLALASKHVRGGSSGVSRYFYTMLSSVLCNNYRILYSSVSIVNIVCIVFTNSGVLGIYHFDLVSLSPLSSGMYFGFTTK